MDAGNVNHYLLYLEDYITNNVDSTAAGSRVAVVW